METKWESIDTFTVEKTVQCIALAVERSQQRMLVVDRWRGHVADVIVKRDT